MNTMKDSTFWVFSWTTFVRQEEGKKKKNNLKNREIYLACKALYNSFVRSLLQSDFKSQCVPYLDKLRI